MAPCDELFRGNKPVPMYDGLMFCISLRLMDWVPNLNAEQLSVTGGRLQGCR